MSPRSAPSLSAPSLSAPTRLRIAALVIAAALVAAGCADDSDESTEPDESTTSTTTSSPSDSTDTTSTSTSTTTTTTATTTTLRGVPMPEITGPVTGGDGPAIPQPAAPLPEGYVQEEFFIGGTATSFTATGELGNDGVWDASPDVEADFRTRILVRRPPAERFSGVVLVEWFNVSAIEASPDWAYLAEEIGRAGHVYVGASVQSLGVVGGETLLQVDVDEEAADRLGSDSDIGGGGLVNADPERYGTLTHPGDAWAFDIYGQIGAAVANGSDSVLGGLEPSTVIAVGESQSAGFLTTYLNAVHPLGGVYDAALVHSRGASGPALVGGYARSSDDDGVDITSGGTVIRTDLDIPVLIFEAETDLTLLGYHRARQPDTDLIRTWEVAGLAHSDAHVFRVVLGGGRDGSLGSLLGCETPVNTGPHHEVLSAALARLVGWAQGGSPPPTADRLELVEGDTVAIARDELGIAVGGVRNPLVDVPVAVVTGDPAPGVAADRAGGGFDVCALFGQTIPLDQATLLELHGSADEYLAAFTASAESAVEAGFLLQADADQLIAEAEANRALFG